MKFRLSLPFLGALLVLAPHVVYGRRPESPRGQDERPELNVPLGGQYVEVVANVQVPGRASTIEFGLRPEGDLVLTATWEREDNKLFREALSSEGGFDPVKIYDRLSDGANAPPGLTQAWEAIQEKRANRDEQSDEGKGEPERPPPPPEDLWPVPKTQPLADDTSSHGEGDADGDYRRQLQGDTQWWPEFFCKEHGIITWSCQCYLGLKETTIRDFLYGPNLFYYAEHWQGSGMVLGASVWKQRSNGSWGWTLESVQWVNGGGGGSTLISTADGTSRWWSVRAIVVYPNVDNFYDWSVYTWESPCGSLSSCSNPYCMRRNF